MSAYSDPGYLESLGEFGEPLWLPDSECGILLQPIEGTGLIDARGPYPLFSCGNWESFESELTKRALGAVSFVGVADPLASPGEDALREVFNDRCIGYKQHHVVSFEEPYGGPTPEGHRRNLARAILSVQVEAAPSSPQLLEEWCGLYDGLIRAKGISGIAAFSRRSFEVQFRLPSMRAFQAACGGRTVAMTLWLVDGDRAYYHLGAANEAGYQRRAMYALFDAALRSLEADGVREVLLGAGAGVWGDSSDGLSRFKAGWSNDLRTAFLCGLVLDRDAHSRLSRGIQADFFPEYRAPLHAAA